MRRAALIAVILGTLIGVGSAPPASALHRIPAKGAGGYVVYWDQNEEQDYLVHSSGQMGQLIAPWNPNGQMCIVPDGSGRFLTGYNPTTDPTNPGFTKPAMQPPIGEAMWDTHGNFTGQTLYVPGPYHLPGQTVGGDVPPNPANGTFNDNGTMTGCAFDRHANLFAADLGTAQGQFPAPDDGRLIEWFAPAYTSYCIVYGPTAGGDGPHHVDGTGGLSQPGELAFDQHGNLMLPEAGSAQTGGFSGRVLRLDGDSLPRRVSECDAIGLYPRTLLRSSVFMQGSLSFLPFPQSAAFDPACNCWGVATTIGDPAIAFFDNNGKRLVNMGQVHGETILQVGTKPKGWNPFGLAFAPDGTAYFVDIHITCTAPLTNCGPGQGMGRVMKVTFTHGTPDRPTVVAGGYSFPTSVMVCVPRNQTCPRPSTPANTT